MIKCKVTLAGVVNKAATTHEGKDGKPFVSFGVNLPLGDKNGNCREFEVSVSADPAIATAGLLSIGKRVQVVGTLYFRKRDNTMYLNMYADSITIDVSEIDKLEGEMEFKGRTGNKSILLCLTNVRNSFRHSQPIPRRRLLMGLPISGFISLISVREKQSGCNQLQVSM